MRYFIARLLTIGWIAVLVYGSLAPADDVEGAYVFGDFVLHAFGYFGLTVLFVFSQRQPKIWISAIVAMIIGIALEGVQGLTPDRSMQAVDALANAVGALTGAGFFWLRGCFRSSSPA